jgi:hypothetical protein
MRTGRWRLRHNTGLLLLHGNGSTATEQLATHGVAGVMAKCKLQGCRGPLWLSRNNQDALKHKTSTGQSLQVPFPAYLTHR